MSKKSPQPNARLKSKPIQEVRKTIELKEYPQSWYFVCWAIYLCYCYAAFFSMGAVWGIHFIAYIPVPLKVILLLIGGALLVPQIQRFLFLAVGKLFSSEKKEHKIKILSAAIVTGICFILFHSFTIKTDIYGDHIYIVKNYDNNSSFDWNWIGNVLNPKLNLNENLQGYSEALTIGVHRIVAHFFSISIESSYRVMSELCGATFVFIWLLFVQKITNEDDRTATDNRYLQPLRMVLILLGMFAGAMQVFFGHVENYPFGILIFTFFLIALYFYIEEKIGTLAFVFIYLVALRAHIVGILFLPAVLVALANRYRNALPKLPQLFTWRAILAVVIIPALILGLGSYFFLFHSWNEPYSYVYANATGRQLQESFLPIVTCPAPIDHYSLWSLYHIADFFNLLLLISAPIAVILANLMIFNRKNINWSQPRVIIFGLAALFPFLFFTALNPQLTPARDWDLYTLLFPPLLFFASILLIQSGVRQYVATWLAQSVVFGVIFTSVLVAVDASPDELQLRLLDAGAYTYHSYYATSKFIETWSFAMNYGSKPALDHFSSIVHKLSSVPTDGKDPELGEMMSFLARVYAIAGNDSVEISWEEMARKTDTSSQKYIVDLAGAYVNSNRLTEGSNIIREFLKSRTERNDTANSYRYELADVMAQLGARYSRTGEDDLTIAWAEAARKVEPLILKYTYDLAAYYLQSDRPKQALDLLHSIPPDSVSVDGLTTTAIAAANAFGPDSGLPYLYKAKEMAPNDLSVDSLIIEMKKVEQ